MLRKQGGSLTNGLERCIWCFIEQHEVPVWPKVQHSVLDSPMMPPLPHTGMHQRELINNKHHTRHAERAVLSPWFYVSMQNPEVMALGQCAQHRPHVVSHLASADDKAARQAADTELLSNGCKQWKLCKRVHDFEGQGALLFHESLPGAACSAVAC